MGDDERPDGEPNGEMVPFTMLVPPLLLEVLRFAGHRRGKTAEEMAREVLAEWAIGEIRH